MRFTKMHGAGNDYVYVDCFRESTPHDPAALAQAVSHRRKGIGADGLILIAPSSSADAKMLMWNADGSPSDMCGNGLRCVAAYVHNHGICKKPVLRIETGRGVLEVELILQSGRAIAARVDMGAPIFEPEKIPTGLPGSPVVNAELKVGDRSFQVTSLSMGNPHCVIYVDNATDELVLGVGPKIEVHPLFPKRVNVEFVEVMSRTEVRQRTWERGSGETWACGSGACAVAVAGVLTKKTDRNLKIHLLGGDLDIEYETDGGPVIMTGPVAEVFSGEFPWP
jgi:diaminopimelate epimerase